MDIEMTPRLKKNWISSFAILLMSLSGATIGLSQELPLAPGDETGVYLVDLGDGETIELSLVVEGPAWMEDPEVSECLIGREFRLLVGVSGADHPFETLVVPLESACEIVDVRAIRRGDGLLFAIRGEYHGTCGRGENHLRRWVAVEKGKDLRLIENSLDPGPYCYHDPWRIPKPDIHPKWRIHGGELWMDVSVRSFLCYQHGNEVRGKVEWIVGEPPEPVEFGYRDSRLELLPEIQSMGFQPYGEVAFGRGIFGVLAEIPWSIGGPRLLAVVDRKGRRSIVLLPQFGYGGDGGLREKAADLDDWYLRRFMHSMRNRQEDWPQLKEVQAYRYSKPFLDARSGASVQTLLKKRKVSIHELSLPCVEAVDPSPTGAISERWLLRLDQNGDEPNIEAYLVEPCSSGELGGGGPTEYFLPSATLEVDGRSVTLGYSPPQVDLERLAGNKFLFDNLRFLRKHYSTAVVRVHLDGPTETIPRCDPAVPTSGLGWFALESEGCEIDVRFGHRANLKDWTPPSFVETPILSLWCAGLEMKPGTHYLTGKVGSDGRIVGLRSGLSKTTPAELVAEINEWRLRSAVDSEGNPTEAWVSIDVTRGLPIRASPITCQ